LLSGGIGDELLHASNGGIWIASAVHLPVASSDRGLHYVEQIGPGGEAVRRGCDQAGVGFNWISLGAIVIPPLVDCGERLVTGHGAAVLVQILRVPAPDISIAVMEPRPRRVRAHAAPPRSFLQ